MANDSYDVIVVGGGPSGSSCAFYLGKAGYNVLLLEKGKFPRDKICGDGISGKSVRVLQEMGLTESMKKIEHLDMFGVTFSSPNGVVVPVPSKTKEGQPPGYVCRREVFDEMLFKNAKRVSTVVEQFNVNDLLWEGEGADKKVVGVKGINMATREKKEYRAKVVVGADGASSLISTKVGYDETNEDHQIVGVRAYFEKVGGLTDQIELHFVDSLIPGYFWIFPLPGGRANVGSGMITSDIKKGKVNLTEETMKIINDNPLFKDRFKNAKQTTPMKSWSLPVGSIHKRNHGNGFVLVGDAASLIDPFTGEGIGNALMSGKIAAKTIDKALATGDFSAKMLSEYDAALWEEIGKEIDTSYNLQKMSRKKFLLNFVISKAAKKEQIRNLISDSMLSADTQKKFYSPFFYLKLLLS